MCVCVCACVCVCVYTVCVCVSCTHIYTHPIFGTRTNGHMLKLHRQTHTCTDTHTMKSINLQRYIYSQYFTKLTLTMCTTMNLQGYMYTHYTYTTHIGIHTPYTPTHPLPHTHTHRHTHTHTSTQVYITHIKSYKTHNLTNCLHDLVYILNMKRKNNKQ